MSVLVFLAQLVGSILDPIVALPCIVAAIFIPRLVFAVLFGIAWAAVIQAVMAMVTRADFALLPPRMVGLAILSALCWWLAKLYRQSKLKES